MTVVFWLLARSACVLAYKGKGLGMGSETARMYSLDAGEVLRALRLFYDEGDCFEVRVLGVMSGVRRQPHVEGGYFDYAHLEEVPRQLDRFGGMYRGVYVTPNPCLPELLARCCNRIDRAENQTKDSEIVSRKWLLIDFDPVRPSGIASTDAQHRLAMERALGLRTDLSGLGWPDPVVTDSGNGAQMMYRVSLPSEDGGIARDILQSLARSNDKGVEVDVKVCNAARIWRLPGTWNRKGDDVPSNPHRMARLVSVPEELREVPMECLQAVARWARSPEDSGGRGAGCVPAAGGGSFDVVEWMRVHFPDARGPVDYRDGMKWVFRVCPFDSSHTDGSACLTVTGGGRIGFVCHHNGCSGKGWRDLREMVEPGCYSREERRIVSPEELGVDLSNILRIAEDADAAEAADLDDGGQDYLDFPEELYDVPGIVNDVKELTLKYAPTPNRPLALCGAVSLMSYICARKVKTPSGLRSNLYVLALAPSGCGKERPRDINQMILQSLQWDDGLLDNVASGEALEDALKLCPALLWQCDEFYSTLHNMAIDTGDNRNTTMKYLLQLYTSAHKKFKTRAKVGFPSVDIMDPHLTLFATTTPNGFFDHISDRFLMDGMFSRLSVFIAEKPARGRLTDEPVIPEELLRRIKAWKDWQPMGSGNIDTSVRCVPFTEDGHSAALALREYQNDEYEREMNSPEPSEWKLAVKNRLTENALRYALIHACSKAASPGEASIDSTSVAWGSKLVQYEVCNKIRMTERKYFRSQFEKYTEAVIGCVHCYMSKKRRAMPGWMFSRQMKYIDPKTLGQVVQALESQKRLVITPTGRGGGLTYAIPGMADK